MEASDRNSLVEEAGMEPCFVGREVGVGNMVSGEGAEHCSGPEGCVEYVISRRKAEFSKSSLFTVVQHNWKGIIPTAVGVRCGHSGSPFLETTAR